MKVTACEQLQRRSCRPGPKRSLAVLKLTQRVEGCSDVVKLLVEQVGVGMRTPSPCTPHKVSTPTPPTLSSAENTTRALLYVAMTRGRDTNTAYLYERIAGDSEHSQPHGVHILRRGTTRQAAQLARTLIANHEDQARSAHEIAAEVPDGSALPERVRSLLRRRSDAIRHRLTTYQHWCDAFAGLNLNDGRTVDQQIDRRKEKDLGYETGL
jgi:hypothetical protein